MLYLYYCIFMKIFNGDKKMFEICGLAQSISTIDSWQSDRINEQSSRQKQGHCLRGDGSKPPHNAD